MTVLQFPCLYYIGIAIELDQPGPGEFIRHLHLLTGLIPFFGHFEED